MSCCSCPNGRRKRAVSATRKRRRVRRNGPTSYSVRLSDGRTFVVHRHTRRIPSERGKFFLSESKTARRVRSAASILAALKKRRKGRRIDNPLLQVVLPNRRRRARRNPPAPIRGYPARGGARVRGGQRISRVGFVAEGEARKYPGFAAALKLHRDFHGRAPTHFTRLRIEDGDPRVTKRAVVLIGEVPRLQYRTWRYANSSKSHTASGQRILWDHKMGERGGKPTYAVHDPVSGVTSLVGGTYRVAGRPAFYHN